MKVIVVGGGEVGFHLASVLSRRSHEITVVDMKSEALVRFQEALDVETFVGHGAGVTALRKIGAGGSDLFVAVTNSDEINMLACLGAKELGARSTVARVGDPIYLEGTRAFYRNLMGIDLVVSPEILTALEITKSLKSPGMVAIEHLVEGELQVRQIRILPESPISGKKIKDLQIPVDLLITAINRDHNVIIPGGTERIRVGDEVMVVGRKDSMAEFDKTVGGSQSRRRKVVLVGGGEVGLMVAQMLEEQGCEVRLIERDEERCRELSRLLRQTTVLHGDGTDLSLLRSERVESIDFFAALSKQDEVNLLAGILCKELGVPKVVVLTHRPDYMPIVERLDIDEAISPRILTAQTIIRHVTRDQLVPLAQLHGGGAGLYEVKVHPESSAVGQPIRNLQLPAGTIVAALVEEDKVTIPRGTDTINKGQTLLVFAFEANVEALEKTFLA
ncbi:MAG: Trk system potassium transporter TrkA [Candidatus Eisenbacteria bacterium]|uniref:Trk system potassium uptake protein TrkA n=1 Tax=Eiseniibacteriota bacterium TaxID=2212470 RepID=A0A948RRE0_UNCEI|nr:Trk system potassium transporter TrkA [Candidatus Eisenbacteria bacterium]MBU1950161.1 Trk system potassium transporter TrkA [Candidatus Eisenbacteria bacterium]MBU2689613.1 Trk system potassium transporter TrkA [Candidatus Eisenbacteria bacterium]